MKRILFIIALSLALTACDRKEPESDHSPRPVKSIVVKSDNLLNDRVFPARILAGDNTDIAFKRTGQLEALPIREGMSIKAGQVLARLNNVDATLRVNDRQSAFNLAQRQFQRFQSLSGNGAVSRSEMDVQRANRDSARAALDSAKEELNYLTLTAPFDGVIARVNVRNHQVVAAGQTIATISRTEMLDVVFTIPERLFTALDASNVDYQPRVRINSLPGREFTARYKEHTTNTDAGSLTYQVTLVMPRPDDLPTVGGLSGTVTVSLGNLPNASRDTTIIVPSAAVFNPDSSQLNQAHVWVIAKNEQGLYLEDRKVSVGQMTSQGIEITEGLQDGEQIVVAGVAELSAQQPVRIWTRERGL